MVHKCPMKPLSQTYSTVPDYEMCPAPHVCEPNGCLLAPRQASPTPAVGPLTWGTGGLVTDWAPNERKRWVGGVLVYRSYEDYVDD